MKRKANVNHLIIFWLIMIVSASCSILKKDKLSNNYKPIIPKELVVPIGYKISYIYNKYSPLDFNKDGLSDFAFLMRKEKINNGDSSLVVFYKMNKDSTFSFYKQYDNIVPTFFFFVEDYPVVKDKQLESLFYDCYRGISRLLYSFDIQNDSIIIIKRLDRTSENKLKYIFKFDAQQNDWLLISKSRFTKDGYYPIVVRKPKLLSNFSYCED